MPKPRNRYIPRDVARHLAALLRDRCCLCTAQIDPHTYSRTDLSDFLEKHHVIFFSDGGEHTIDNLILLCPTCHAKVHANPERFSAETLRDRKTKWIQLTTVVASDDDVGVQNPSCAAIRVGTANELTATLFSIESLNLQYTLWVPDDGSSFTVGDLAQVVFKRILMPVAVAEGNQNWLHSDHMDLALRSNPNTTLPSNAPLEQFSSLDNPFIGHLRTVAIPVNAPETATARKHIGAWVRDGLRLIPIEEVAYFQADQKSVTVRHDGGEGWIEESLKSLEEEFSLRFTRIHRNVLVADAFMEGLEKSEEGHFWLRIRGCEERLIISHRHSAGVRRKLADIEP